METCRSRTMRLAVLVCQLGLFLRCEAQQRCAGHATFRPPENSDVSVQCGTEEMEASIYLCPVYFALYNESLMALNARFTQDECHGVPDWTADPPVLKFRFPINESAVAVCGNKYKALIIWHKISNFNRHTVKDAPRKITSEIGSGIFSDFSNVQFVNISGVINALDLSAGAITYRQQILYLFSCRYPMQYLVNNTELGVSGVSFAMKDNNGSFISTLSMMLYGDSEYSQQLMMPTDGLSLKTKIFVGVKATNLTARFNVLLDRCYATTSPSPSNSTFYDLFVGCTRDGQTKVDLNGESQMAHFSFEAFRFVEHKDLIVSIFYLHCITRLCEVSSCTSLKPNCTNSSRRRRDVASTSEPPTEEAVVTSQIIKVSSNGKPIGEDLSGYPSGTALQYASNQGSSGAVVGVAVTLVIVAIICVAMAIMFGLYIRRRTNSQWT